MNLLIRKPNILNLALHFDYIIKADGIYIYDYERKFSGLDKLNIFGVLTKKVLNTKWIRKKIITIEPSVFAPLLWQSNIESLELAEKIKPYITSDASYNFTSRQLNNSEKLINFYLAKYVLYISRVIHIRKIYEYLNEEKKLVLISGAEEFSNLANHEKQLMQPNHILTKRSLLFGAVGKLMGNIFYKIEWFFMPTAYLIYALFCYKLWGLKKAKYKILMQMHWGVPDDIDKEFGRYQQNDYYLYGEDIKSGDVLHYYDGTWDFSLQKRVVSDEFMRKNNYNFFERRERRITLSFIYKIIFLQWNLWVGFFRNIGKESSSSIQNISAWGLWRYMERELDLINFDIKAYYDRSDYNPSHIIDTVVMNNHGIQTVGMHHCASPYDSPQIAFVHYDHYIALGGMFKKPFIGYWDEAMIEEIGRMHIDWVVNIKQDTRRCDHLFEYANTTYGPFEKLAVLVLPGEAYYMFPERWSELIAGLEMFVSSKLNIGVFVRFKSKDNLDASVFLKKIWELCKTDERLILDHQKFTTYDCMAISDLIIAPNCSSAINEAIAIDVPVFSFDFHDRPGYLLNEYGSDFIIKTGFDLYDRLEKILHGFSSCKVDWNLLKSDANYTYDGNNQVRICNLMSNIVNG